MIGVDNSTGRHAGNLYVVMYNWTGSQMQVEVVTSSDGGMTWGAPVPVEPSTAATHDQFFPWLSVGPTGIVGATWLDRRNDPSNISYQPFAAVSIDGGVNFGANIKLSQNLSNPNDDGFGGTFMGDYTGNTSVGKKVYASWMDSSSAINMQDEVGGLLGAAGNGVDISRAAGDVADSVWQDMVNAGIQFVVVQAWGGSTQSPCAKDQLAGDGGVADACPNSGQGTHGAQSKGLVTGAFALLNYDDPTQSGHYQVGQALEAIGTAITDLKLLVIDVEPIDGESLTQTSAAIKMRIGRVSGAVSAAQATSKKVAIYTDRGSWKEITGNCSSSKTALFKCSNLVSLPLWDVEHKAFVGPDGRKHCGDGIVGLVPFNPYPPPPSGWLKRFGNQYDYDDTDSGCNGTTLFGSQSTWTSSIPRCFTSLGPAV